MKKQIKSGVSLLLVLALAASLFAGLTFTVSAVQPTSAADVDYVNDGKYVYNWGKRDTTATFLTTYANSYYTGSYSYEALSALSGDSGTGTAFYSSPLGTAIHNMLVAKQTYTNSYDANKTLFKYTECEESSQTTMSSYYSGKELPNYWDSQATWNREHTWPNSKGLGGSDENDVMMIKPTWVNENSSRGNTAYGESGSYYDPNGNGQSMHGDVARLMLQHLMRWGNTSYFYGSGGVMENRAVLLKWLAEDPVDTWEMGRNDSIQQITGVRNVFVDYPELAFQLLGAEVPAGFVTPSGNGGTVTNYTINATSNNTAWGTVFVSGTTITATPKTGYYASGYTVTSGTATVTQNGNAFTVVPSSDCTVRINFAAKTAVTVSFHVPAGVTQASVSGYAGEAITLPSPNGTPTDTSHTYTFLGWVTGTYDNVTDKPAAIYTAGSEYTPSSSTTLNALYRYSEGGGSGASGYSKITEQSELVNGNYIIISSATGKALGSTAASNWLAAGSTYDKNATSISEATASGDVWTYTDGKLSTGDKYLTSTGAKNISVSSTQTVWTFTVASGAWTIKNGNNILSYNSSGWRPYSGGYGNDKTFYVFKEGIVGSSYYTTNLSGCAHSHTQQVAAVAATCTAIGYTAGVYCTDCQTYISGRTELPMLEHSYNNGAVTTPATCTAVGVKTFTCTACGATRTEDVPALGHSYGAFVSNNNGTHSKTCSRCQDNVTENCDYTASVSGATTTYTCSVCAYSYSSTANTYTVTFNDCGSVTTAPCIDGDSVTLPTTGSTVEGYTFAGWVAAAINPETTTAPTILTGSYEPSANVTLYALYTRTESTGGASGLVKMQAGDTLSDGDEIVIVANGTTVALYQETVNSSYVNKYTFDNNINTVLADDKNYLTVNAVSGGFTLGDATNGYLSSSSNNLYVRSSVQTWTLLDLEDDTFKLQSGGRNLSYRSDLSTQYWRMGGSNYGTSGKTVLDLYKVGGAGGTTYYTTSPVAASSCDHSNLETVAAVAATCTTGGNNLYYHCPDCDKCFADSACNAVTSVEAQTVAALGHDYTETVIPATCTEAGSTTSICSRCGDTTTETIPAKGHTWDNGVVTTPATATSDGVMTFTCTVCAATRTDVIPAVVSSNYTQASEITSGDEYIMAFHYVSGSTDKWLMVGGVSGSACTVTEIPAPVNGVLTIIDSITPQLWTISAVENTTDGYSLKLGNSFLRGTSGSTNLSNSTTAVTWTATAGKQADTFWLKVGSRAIGLQYGSSVKNYATSNYSATATTYIFDLYLFSNACSHAHTELQGAVEATCTTNGYTGNLVCLDCGATVSVGTVILQGHDYVEVSRTEPTCTTAGNIHFECSRCDKTKDEVISALGHNYEQTAHADATCTQDGYTTYTCANCNDSYTDNIPAIGHNYDAETGECANCGDQLGQYTVSFTVPTGIDAIESISAFDGATITLPTPTGTLLADAENYVFAGWTTADVQNAASAEYEAAGEYIVTDNVTFKALYTWVDADDSFGNEGVYKLLTEGDAANLSSGWTLIIANDGKWQSKTMALAGFANSGNDKLVGKNVTVSSNTITLPATTEVQIFTVVKEGNYFYLISDYTDSEGTLYYLTSCTNTANANNITLTDTPTAAAKWALTYHEDGTAKLTAQGSWTANTIQFNSSNYSGFFSCYGETYYGAETMPSNIYGIRIFASNPVYHYTTAPVQHCDHLNVTWTDNEDGTCTAACDDCGHVTVANQAHAWTLDPDAEGSVAATCLNGGKEGYFCSNCAATKLEDTAALGHDYVGQETTAPTCSAAGEMTYTCSRCDDNYTDAIPAIDHTFTDGTCTMCGASLFVRVTEAPENWEGEYLIVYVSNDNAKVFDGKTDAANNFTVGTFYGEAGNESNLICVPNPDDYTVMFDPANNGYRIMNADANWWSYTAAKNGFSTNTNTSFAGNYSISLDANGNAVIKNAGNYAIKFNTQSSQFRFYGTSIYTTVKLYEKYGTCHHNWMLDETASTAATCTAAGNNVYVCSLCQETKNEIVAALNHDYQYENVAATCTDEGYTICTCSRCDYEEILDYTITPALGHSFTIAPDVTDADHYLAPTATEDGLMYYQCDRCGAWDEEGEIIPALGVVTSKTYTMLTADDFDSYETALANVGQFIIVAEAEGTYYALSLNGNGTVLNAVPISVFGTSTTVSSDSGIAALIPDYEATNYAETETGLGFRNEDGNYLHLNSTKMNFNATAENGLFTVAKAYTDDTFTLFVAATGKYLVFDGESFTMANSKTNAAKLYIFVANTLDITYNNAVVSALTVDADSEGTLGYILNLNAANVIAAWSSDNEDAIMIDESTGAFLAGSTGTANVTVSLYTYDASWQNYQLYTATIPVTISGTVVETPKILGAALVLNHAIDVVYTAKVPAGYTNAKLTVNGTEITEYTVDGNGNYRFTYAGVNPQCMGDNLSATLTAVKSGTTYTDTKAEYSVREYCVNKLNDSMIDAQLRTLLSDLLAYGAAAQTYMNYKTNALVNVRNDINNPTYSTFSSLSGLGVSFDGTADDSYRWISAGLTLTNSVAMNFRFYAESIDGLTVNININGRTQSFTQFTAVEGKANTYEISFTGIGATEFGDNVTASFTKNGTPIGNTVSYSVNIYVQSKQTDSNTALQALVKALYNYGAAANAFSN